LKKKAIIQVGLSRSCKSTLFNIINHIQHIGVPSTPTKDKNNHFGILSGTVDVIYQPKTVSTDIAEANNGVKSVTLLPNISDRGDYSLIDMPGYHDERRYDSAIGVSYVIKSTFKIVEECQFVLVIKENCFKSGQVNELIKTLTGFCNMFNVELLNEDLQKKILQSVTFVIAKSIKNASPETYIMGMENFLQQARDPTYNKYQAVKKIAFIMEYFCKHP
jgi:hypothetical protein